MSNNCKNCNAGQPEGSHFCNHCGKPIGDVVPVITAIPNPRILSRPLQVLIILVKICLWGFAFFVEIGSLDRACHGDLTMSVFFSLVLFALIGFNKRIKSNYKWLGLAATFVIFISLIAFSQSSAGKSSHASMLRQDAINEAQDKAVEAKKELKRQKIKIAQANHYDVFSSPKHHYPYSTQKHEVSKGIALSYSQVTDGLAEKFGIQEGTPINGRQSWGGQDGYKGPSIQVIGNHNNIWEAALVVQMPNDVDPMVALANATSLMLFMKNVSPSWNDSNNWLVSAGKKAKENPGTRITTSRRGITYTVMYIEATSATILTARPQETAADDILDEAR